MQRETLYIIGFSAAVCGICSILVAGAAVALKDRQEENAVLDRQKKVLVVAGLMQDGEKITAEDVRSRFDANIQPEVIVLKTGEAAPDVSPQTFSQKKEMSDPTLSHEAPPNAAKVSRLPEHAMVYRVVKDGVMQSVIFPVEGKGLWSTLYGYVALEKDLNTVRGLTFYAHGETPGLGGEIDNPKWKALWPGRKVFKDGSAEPQIQVIKGAAGSPQEDPYEVDGLSGATITSRGVTHLMQFWLGEQGFAPYLHRLHESPSQAL